MVQKTVSVLCRIDMGSEDTVLEKLRQIENVSEARLVLGKFDLFVSVAAEGEALERTLEKIRSLEKVQNIRIMLPRSEGEGE